MSEKSISERAKDTLKWIQKEQKASGSGMVEFSKIPDQSAVRFLLRKGDVFEPEQGMIKSAVEPEPEESAGEFPTHAPWVWRTPKPKRKGDVPEPYEFLAYSEWSVLPSEVAEALRGMGFAGAPFLYEGYSYRKMMGGALRRKMIGQYSREQLLADLKQREDWSEEEWAKFEEDLDRIVVECRGKSKQVSEVEVSHGIVYYPKDGSFDFR
ncbi:MAG: hypothetical protein ACQCN6_01040 [Candidatus Bathyarchaeia archaeon]|jgi:hypothetical protein